MPSRMVALVLRQQAVELLEAQQTFGRCQVKKAIQVPLPGPEDAQLIQAIRLALTNAEINPKTTRIGVVVPAQDVLLRSFRLPQLPKGEWASAVQFEVRKYIPFKTSDLVWDFYAAEDRSMKLLDVVFAGIRSDGFARLQRCLAEAEIRPAFVDAPGFCLARVLASSEQAGEGFTAIVDIEPDAAHLVIVKDQLPYLARDIPLSTATLETGPGDPPASGTDARAEKLLSELRLSLDFFSRERQASVTRVLLFGNDVVIGPWGQWLSGQLSCPVQLGSLSLRGSRAQSLSLEFGCAVGAGLRELRPAKAKLDFLGRSQRAAVESGAKSLEHVGRVFLDPASLKSAIVPAALQAAVAIMGVIGLTILGTHQVSEKRLELRRTVAALRDPGWGLQALQQSELETLGKEIDARLAFLRRTVSQRISVTEKLDGLAKILPEGVWFDNLTYEDRSYQPREGSQTTLTLQGNCFLPNQTDAELEAISQFAASMKADPKLFRGFGVAQLADIQTKMEERPHAFLAYRTFRLTCGPGQSQGRRL